MAGSVAPAGFGPVRQFACSLYRLPGFVLANIGKEYNGLIEKMISELIWGDAGITIEKESEIYDPWSIDNEQVGLLIHYLWYVP